MRGLLAGATGLVLVLGAADVSAQDTAYVPTLSTSAQRVCTSDTRQSVLLDARSGAPLGQPATTRETSRFHAAAAGDGGYLFILRFDSDEGDIELEARIATDGSVMAAEVTGSAIEGLIAAELTDAEQLALFMARDIPELALLGRRYRAGDSYYSAAMSQTLLEAVIGRLGTPFPLQGVIDITYRGEGMAQGRASRDFSGTITVEGSGAYRSDATELRYLGQFDISHDAETGLLLSSHSDHRSSLLRNASVAHDSVATVTVTCEIGPL